MNQEELAHAIRAACELTHDSEMIVVGSQSIHGSFADTTPLLRLSNEVGLMPMHQRANAQRLNTLGEMSPFHRAFGFYIDVVDPSEITLPEGWEQRLCPFYPADANGNTGWCLDPVDLACAKLAAFRDKDRAFVRELIIEGFVRKDDLLIRLVATPLSAAMRDRLTQWVTRITRDDAGEGTRT